MASDKSSRPESSAASSSQVRHGLRGDQLENMRNFPAFRQRSYLAAKLKKDNKYDKKDTVESSEKPVSDTECENSRHSLLFHLRGDWKSFLQKNLRQKNQRRYEKGKFRFLIKNWSRSRGIDFYFWLLDIPILVLFAFVAIIYTFIAVVFAGFYDALGDDLLDPDGARPSGVTKFGLELFFSLENVLAVGFGSFFPEKREGYVLSTIEQFMGTIVTSVLLGIVVTRISRPRSKIIFSKIVLITYRNNVAHVMIRIGNMRGNNLYFPNIRLVLAFPHITDEGETYFKFMQLPIEPMPPYVSACFQVAHKIDEDSPLFGLKTREDLPAGARIYISVSAVDDVHYTTVNSVRIYFDNDIVFDSAFTDMIAYDHINGVMTADFSQLSEYKIQKRGHIIKAANAWLTMYQTRKKQRMASDSELMEKYLRDGSLCSKIETDFANQCVGCTSG